VSPSPEPGLAPPRPIGEGFGAVVGQETVVAALQNALGRGRLPHALLLGGPQGVGKATVAGILAQAVNCPERGPLDACGKCSSCGRIARGLHPDVHWVAPSPRIIPVDAIRAINAVIGYSPHEGNRRVIVIDDAHLMNPNAQNAFLKTLEEPPPSALILLVTPAPGRLLPTVRSRCQSLQLAPVPLPRVREYLERQGLDPAQARLRAALAPGSIGGALSVDLDTYAEQLDLVVGALRLAQGSGAGIVQGAEQLVGAGDGETATGKAAAILGVARDVLRDLLVVASGSDEATLVNLEQRDAWRAWAKEISPEGAAEALAAVNAGIERLTTGITPGVKTSLEKTLIAVHRALNGLAAPAAR